MFHVIMSKASQLAAPFMGLRALSSAIALRLVRRRRSRKGQQGASGDLQHSASPQVPGSDGDAARDDLPGSASETQNRLAVSPDAWCGAELRLHIERSQVFSVQYSETVICARCVVCTLC